jgi:hypothetical protein
MEAVLIVCFGAKGGSGLAPVAPAIKRKLAPQRRAPAAGAGRGAAHDRHGEVLAVRRICRGDSAHTSMDSVSGPPGGDSALFVIGLIGADASQDGAAIRFANQLAGAPAFRQPEASASPCALLHHDIERGVLYLVMTTTPSRLRDAVDPSATESPPPASASPSAIQSWIAGHAHSHVRALLLLSLACHMVLFVSDSCSPDLALLQALRAVWELRIQTRSAVTPIIAGPRGGAPPAAATLGFVFGPVPDALAADIASAATAAAPAPAVARQAASSSTAASAAVGGAGGSCEGCSSQANAARGDARAHAPGDGAEGAASGGSVGGRGGRGGRSVAGGGAPLELGAPNRAAGGVVPPTCETGGIGSAVAPGDPIGSVPLVRTPAEASQPSSASVSASASRRQEVALDAARRQLESALDDQLRRLIGGSKLLTRAMSSGASSLFALVPAVLPTSAGSSPQAAGGTSACLAHVRLQDTPPGARGEVRRGGGGGAWDTHDNAESFFEELLGMLALPAAPGAQAQGTEGTNPSGGAGGLSALFRDLYAPPPPLHAPASLFSGRDWPGSFSNRDIGRGLPGGAPRAFSLAPQPRPENSARAAVGRDAALRFCHALAAAAAVGPHLELDLPRAGGRGGGELAVGIRVVGTAVGRKAVSVGGSEGGGRGTGKGVRLGTHSGSMGAEGATSNHRTAAEWAVMFEALSSRLMGRPGVVSPTASPAGTRIPPSAGGASPPVGTDDTAAPYSAPEPRLSSPSLTRMMDADALFSSTICAVALARARQAYAHRLPPRYTEAAHTHRVRAAEAELRAGGSGPDYARCLATLRRECDKAWRDGRQECGALSLTGRPCVLPAHALPPMEAAEAATGAQDPPGDKLVAEGSGSSAASECGCDAAGSSGAPGEAVPAQASGAGVAGAGSSPDAGAPSTQRSTTRALPSLGSATVAPSTHRSSASRPASRGRPTLAHLSDATHRLACNCGRSTRLLDDPFSFGQAERLFSAPCCDALPHAWIWLQPSAGASHGGEPRSRHRAAPLGIASSQVASGGTMLPEAAPPERMTAQRAPTGRVPPAPAPVPFTTGVAASAGGSCATPLPPPVSSLASADVACRARLTLLPLTSPPAASLTLQPGMLPAFCSLTPMVLLSPRDAPAVAAAAPESHGGACAEAFPALGSGGGSTPTVRRRGGQPAPSRKAGKQGNSSPVAAARQASLLGDALARVGCEYECCEGHRAILQPLEHAPAPRPQRRRRQPVTTQQQLARSQSPQSQPPQPKEQAALDAFSPVPLSHLLAEPTPLTRPCAHTSCSRIAQLQRIHIQTPSHGASMQLHLRVRFGHLVLEAGSSRGGQSGGDCGGGASGEWSDGTGGGLGGVTLAPFAPVLLPRGSQLVVRLPFVYQAPGGQPLATAATAADERQAPAAVLLPGWLAVVGA